MSNYNLASKALLKAVIQIFLIFWFSFVLLGGFYIQISLTYAVVWFISSLLTVVFIIARENYKESIKEDTNDKTNHKYTA